MVVTRGRRRTSILIVALVLAVTCRAGGDSAPGSSSRATFRTEDGFRLEGQVLGAGQKGIVLSHMYPADQRSWFAAAAELASDRYLVLTFDFRGYGSSQGSKDIEVIDRDVRAAIRHMREELGAAQIVLVGASMGGSASLIASSTVPVAGVVTLSAPVRFRGLDAGRVAGLVSVPKLFIAAEGDVAAAADAEILFRTSADPRQIKIVPGDEHGTDILSGRAGKESLDLIKRFIAEVTA